MKKRFLLLFIFAFSCSYTTSSNYNTVDISNTNFSDIEMMKKGKDCTGSFLFIPTLSSKSIKQATKKGRISKVKYIDSTYKGYPFNFLPLVSVRCITVYGE